MRKTKKQNRWLALTLCLCMLASVFPLDHMTYAAGTGCNHQHDENCGFVEAVEGQPCTFTHAHDDTCGYAEAVEAAPCSVEASHTHETAVCGHVEAVEGQPCTHVHDENCGGLTLGDSGPAACTLTEGCKLPDGHESDCDAPMLLAYSTTQYHSGDVAVVKGIIDRSSLGWNRDDPGSWNTAPGLDSYLIWDGSTPKRIKKLSIYNINNLSGTLDVTSLTKLQYLYCSYNSLNDLKVTGLTGLQELSCRNNNLTKLDLTGLNSLQTLDCPNNNLDDLNVTGLNSLQTLFCYGNPFQSLKLPDGETLTVNMAPADGGTVMFDHAQNLMNNKSVDLTATANAGYVFTEFQFRPDVTENGRNPVSFTLPTGALTVTPVFTPLYNPADIAAVNNIVEAHPELGWQKADPADGSVVSPSWAGSVDWSSDKSNRRIWRLNLADKGLTGTLDVSGLPDLDALHCGNNQLEGLNGLGTLTKLTTLACPNNRLPKLEGLENLTALKTLMCQKNQLTALDGLENLTQLMWLDCEENQLTALDVSALKSNLLLYCKNNPIQSLELTGGYTLLVPPAAGGSVQMTAFNYSAKKVTLSAKADTGYDFAGFQFSPEITASGTSQVSFTLPGGVLTATPAFAKLPIYDPADIAAVNNIVEAHPELGWQKADPADGFALGTGWTGIVWSNSGANQRVTQLDLSGKGLTGTLDVTGLTSLEYLDCSDNSMTGLNVSGLTGLQYLDCSSNPFQSLKLPGGETLTVNIDPANSGTVMFSHGQNLMTNKKITLTATPETGYTFTGWTGDASGSDNPLTLTLDRSMTVTATYHIHKYEGGWQYDDTDHWQLCSCGEAGPKTPHSGGTANCHEKAVCEVCKAAYGSLNPDNHDGGTELRDAKAATEEAEGYTGDTYCKGCGELLLKGETIPKVELGHTHKYEGAWQHDGTDHWQLCSCGEAGPKAPHSGGTANCHEKAVCKVCNTVYGNLNPDNHDGGTELRNAKAATEEAEGYTGDTYCLGCGELLAKGKAIAKTTILQTGDDTLLWPWALLMLSALLGGGFLFAGKRRRKIR